MKRIDSPNFDLLYVVMPVFNEEESVGKVFDEWIPVLNQTSPNFIFLAVNDGSKDNTLNILNEYAKRDSRIRVLSKENSGHGFSCFEGYKLAIQQKAKWVLQIDSDGQCDATYFPEFWKNKAEDRLVFGFRLTRKDGLARWLISRVVSLVVLLSGGVWMIDPNVPYRLMPGALLSKVLYTVPSEFYLTNILITVRLRRLTSKVKWIPIIFRDRFGGSPSIKTFSIFRHGYKLFFHLLNERSQKVSA